MAVSSEHQRRGIGAAMLTHIAQETPGLWCNARQTALGFYARNGWRIVGRPMSFPHIGPHRRMLHPAAPLPDESPDVLHAGRFLRLTRRGHWEMTERRGCSGVVGIVPITDAGELVLVEQFRPPVNANVIELPAGLSGDLPGHESEPMVEAAKRELEEETGFSANSWQEIAAGPVSAGLTNEHVTLFLAEGLQRVSAGGGDASEDIQIHIIPLQQCLSWLEERRSEGLMVDQKVWTGILFALRNQSKDKLKTG
jgi:ADP-ribose pyrophosphatase